ncbi:hypothetical protein Tco_0667073 [Tanacetum coccineum]
MESLIQEQHSLHYKPCGPLIVTTASNQKAVKVFDIRDGEHIMKWDVQSNIVAMDNSSPLQWRNKGKVVLAETESVSLGFHNMLPSMYHLWSDCRGVGRGSKFMCRSRLHLRYLDDGFMPLAICMHV